MLTLENGILGLLQPCRQFLAVQVLGRSYVHAEAVAQSVQHLCFQLCLVVIQAGPVAFSWVGR